MWGGAPEIYRKITVFPSKNSCCFCKFEVFFCHLVMVFDCHFLDIIHDKSVKKVAVKFCKIHIFLQCMIIVHGPLTFLNKIDNLFNMYLQYVWS